MFKLRGFFLPMDSYQPARIRALKVWNRIVTRCPSPVPEGIDLRTTFIPFPLCLLTQVRGRCPPRGASSWRALEMSKKTLELEQLGRYRASSPDVGTHYRRAPPTTPSLRFFLHSGRALPQLTQGPLNSPRQSALRSPAFFCFFRQRAPARKIVYASSLFA